jgi:hypothetical protein
LKYVIEERDCFSGLNPAHLLGKCAQQTLHLKARQMHANINMRPVPSGYVVPGIARDVEPVGINVVPFVAVGGCVQNQRPRALGDRGVCHNKVFIGIACEAANGRGKSD